MSQRYFNFPVCLLKNFLLDSKGTLADIRAYAVYNYALSEYGCAEYTTLQDALLYYDIFTDDPQFMLWDGESIHNQVEFHAPKVGLNTNIFWDFYNNEKTEFEKVCLLGFLAIKSILGNKPFCKVDNKFWLSRMSSSALSRDLDFLPEELQKYANEYQTKKIKAELKNNWGLKTYSRYTRGFYVSFSLKLETLMYEAEKKRKGYKEKQQKREERALLESVLKKLANEGHS